MRHFTNIVLTFALVFFAQSYLRADPVTVGNYLVANGDTITEYTPQGGIVQQFLVPSPSASFVATLRDLVVDDRGRIHVMQRPSSFAVGFQHYLSTLDTQSNTWQHTPTIPDWTLGGVTYYGGIGINNNYVFAPDQETSGDDNNGIIRFPLDDLSNPVRFQQELNGDPGWQQATVGLNGDLYVLARDGDLRRIDSTSFNTLDEINVHAGASVMGVAVAANGDIYTVDLSNQLHHFDSDGVLIHSVSVTGDTDLELSADGTLLVGSDGGTLTVLNINDLSTQTVFDTSLQDRGPGFDRNFVTIVTPAPVPEPVVLPAQAKLADGVQTGGQLSDVFASDDQYLELDPSPTQNPLKQTVDYIVQQEISTSSPTQFRLRLEAKMLGGPKGDVIQTMNLFDYNTNSFELVDIRAAATSDTVVDVRGMGVLSRFVQPKTGEITARVTFSSTKFAGSPFFWSVDIDELVWIIE